MLTTKTVGGVIGVSRRRKRLWDDNRTELLGQSELLVEKGKGGQNYFRAWLIESDVDACPLCGGSVIKVQDLFSKTYYDLVCENDRKRVISLEYRFYKWRCLNEKCKHIFAHDIGFATKYDNVTHRMEDEIANLIIMGRSYSEVHNKFDGAISRQAVGQIFNRWVRIRNEQCRMLHPLQHLAVLCGKTDKGRYTLFLNLDDNIKVFDILYGVDSANIAAVLHQLNSSEVQTVITDCDPVIANAVKDIFPNAVHIISVEYWFGLVAADFAGLAHERIKWCPVRNKDKLITMLDGEIGLRSSDLDKLLEMRPSIRQAYMDFNRLWNMITRRDELWVYNELVDWLESVDADFRRELSATEYQLSFYRHEIEAHMNHRDAVPDRLYRLTSRLEEVLRKQRTFSTEVLKARVLYAQDVDFQDWRGIPIENVIAILEDKDKDNDMEV